MAASCDADGVCKTWSMSTGEQIVSIGAGPHPANCLALDPSGCVVALGGNDGLIRVYNIADGSLVCEVRVVSL